VPLFLDWTLMTDHWLVRVAGSFVGPAGTSTMATIVNRAFTSFLPECMAPIQTTWTATKGS
jgi:hypothetical protein